MSLQDYVVPLIRFSTTGPGTAALEEVVGTAFFIDDEGSFLTCATAFRDSLAAGPLGLAVSVQNAPVPNSIAPVESHEFAPAPWDVVIGRAAARGGSRFTLSTVQATPTIHERVATYGCAAVDDEGGRPTPVFQSTTGDVLREVRRRGNDGAPGIECSFTVSRHMRGAPVFVPARPRAHLLGLCIGNDTLGDLELPATDGRPSWIRTDLRGVVADLRALGQWRPQLLGGMTLRDAMAP